jgi:preprotein translocase subunit SecE
MVVLHVFLEGATRLSPTFTHPDHHPHPHNVIPDQYSSDNIDRMRAAIRKRTEEMGLEKSKLSKQLIEDANQRAKAGEQVQGLDLSKIRGQIPEDMPSMLYDPEDEMTDEEKKEVDPVGQLSLFKQAQNELQNAKWPQPLAAMREVVVMFVVVAATGALIIFWDKFLREIYTNIGFIPSSDVMNVRFEGLELPEGWTNMMSEEDIANLPQGLRESTGGSSGLPDL